KKFKIAEGQWYRYAPSYVSPAYHLLEGFPFIQEPPSGHNQERVLIRHHDYDQCFQSVQLLQWNSQVKFNVTVYRNLPTTQIGRASCRERVVVSVAVVVVNNTNEDGNLQVLLYLYVLTQ